MTMDDERERMSETWRERMSTQKFFHQIYLVQGFACGTAFTQLFRLAGGKDLYLSAAILLLCAISILLLRRKSRMFRRKAMEHWMSTRASLASVGVYLPEKMPEDPQGWSEISRVIAIEEAKQKGGLL